MARFALALAPLLLISGLAGCVNEKEPLAAPPEAPQQPFTVPAVPEVKVDDLFKLFQEFVTKFPERRENKPDHLASRDWIAKTFEDAGLEVIRHKYTQGIPQENILGIKWGIDRENWVIVSGHYDTFVIDAIVGATGGPSHIVSQGAYDDGSGTLIAIYLATLYAKIQPYYTIVFTAFDGEERGLRGSAAFFQEVTEGKFLLPNITFRGIVHQDMFGIGWPTCTPFEFYQNREAVKAAVQAAAKNQSIPDAMLDVRGSSTGGSDHAHWFRANLPAVFFSSDMGELAVPGNSGTNPTGCVPVTAPIFYPFWHQVDTWENMVIMAGGEANLRAGFQNALGLSAAAVHVMSADPNVDLTA
jgi:Zn-dependent M28 family amino/carboxypeptidase